jgi:heat shock protein HtpX
MPLWIRAVIALALAVGFYVFALCIAGCLFLLPIGEVLLTGSLHLKLAFFAWVAAAIVLASIVPPPSLFVFEPPGIWLDRSCHPRLFAEVDHAARLAGQAPPKELYLVPEVNAMVTSRGGFLGVGSTRVMAVGLGLLQVLTVSELRAVLAHEFGHFHGGDTRLGPLVHRTRWLIAKTVSNLSSRHVLLEMTSAPFRLYAQVYLQVTLAVSRAPETAADALAARVAGAGPLRSALCRIETAGVAFDHYLSQELEPVLGAGFVPPVGSGFAAFLASPRVARADRALLAMILEKGRSSSSDSHPCLRDRLAALEGLPEGDASDDRPAIELLSEVPQLERWLLDRMLTGRVPDAAISWEDVGERIVKPALALRAATPVVDLADRPLLALADPEVAKAASAGLDPKGTAKPEARLRDGWSIIEAHVLLRLASDGWTIHSRPGVPYSAERGGTTFVPGWSLTAGPETWAEALRAAGIADLNGSAPAVADGV